MKRHFNRPLLSCLFIFLLTVSWIVNSDIPSNAAPSKTSTSSQDGVSGQGKYKFKVLYTSDHLPAEAQAVLTNAHGGFAIDRREGRGETYFALPGAGIIQISSDMKTVRTVSYTHLTLPTILRV